MLKYFFCNPLERNSTLNNTIGPTDSKFSVIQSFCVYNSSGVFFLLCFVFVDAFVICQKCLCIYYLSMFMFIYSSYVPTSE